MAEGCRAKRDHEQGYRGISKLKYWQPTQRYHCTFCCPYTNLQLSAQVEYDGEPVCIASPFRRLLAGMKTSDGCREYRIPHLYMNV